MVSKLQLILTLASSFYRNGLICNVTIDLIWYYVCFRQEEHTYPLTGAAESRLFVRSVTNSKT